MMMACDVHVSVRQRVKLVRIMDLMIITVIMYMYGFNCLLKEIKALVTPWSWSKSHVYI